MKKPTQRIKIERLAHGGDGVGHLDDGRVVFVPRTLPGDEVEVSLVKQKKSFARGHVVRVVTASELRVEPQCPFFVQGCGGCQFWHTSYADEVALKAEAAFDTLQRISKASLPVPKVVPASSERHYRNRVTFHRKPLKGRASEAALGFFAEGSHDVVAVDDCLISATELNAVRRQIEPALDGAGEVDVTVETAGDRQAVVTIRGDGVAGAIPANLRRFADELTDGGLVQGVEVRRRGPPLKAGDVSVESERLMANTPAPEVRLPAGLFRQVNDAMNEKLVEFICQAAGSLERPRILDLFCGAGNIAFALRDIASHVVGIEGSSRAIEAARALAKAADLEQMTFMVGDLSKGAAPYLEEELSAFELVILDPPRTGAPEICAELAEIGAAKSGAAPDIIYVSCDPACLGRDLKALVGAGWVVRELTFFDMFPRTSHIETVAILAWNTRHECSRSGR